MKQINRLLAFAALPFIFSGCSEDVDLPDNSTDVARTRSIETVDVSDLDDFGKHYFDSISNVHPWDTCGTLDGKLKILDIDRNVLSGFTDRQLISLCMNHPLWLLYTAYNNQLDGIKIITERFSGFAELKSRKGYAGFVMPYYRSKTEGQALKKSIIAADNHLKAQFIELLIAYGNLPEMTTPENESILREIISGNENSDFSRRALVSELNGMSYSDEGTTNILPQAITIFGSIIEGVYNREFSQSDIEYITNYWRNRHPKAIFLDYASNTYNCHSYAWNLTDNLGPVCWIDFYTSSGSANVSKFWTNDTYHLVSSLSGCDKIFYDGGDHSAVNDKDGYVISKWGYGPLMKHKPTDCPYEKYTLRYYKRFNKSGVLTTSYGSGETTVNNVDSYYIPKSSAPVNRMTYSLKVENGKGDVLIGENAENDGIVIVEGEVEGGYRLRFTRPGLYTVYITGYNYQGIELLTYEFQPIVTL